MTTCAEVVSIGPVNCRSSSLSPSNSPSNVYLPVATRDQIEWEVMPLRNHERNRIITNNCDKNKSNFHNVHAAIFPLFKTLHWKFVMEDV